MKTPIVLIPLDSRPVNTQLPCDIAAAAGFRVIKPPLSILGALNKPAILKLSRCGL